MSYRTARTRIGSMTLSVVFLLLLMGLLAAAAEAQNLLVNGDFSAGSDNQPKAWRSEAWIDIPTTRFTWLPPSSGEPGEIEISNAKLNDSRWIQRVTLEPGLYYAGAEIMTQGIPLSSWAGALVSIGDQGVASLDVKGNTNWSNRGLFFTVSRPHTEADIKLRIAGFKNFAAGQAFFRNAVLYKMDSAPNGALVLDLDADHRLWAGSPWTLLPVWLFLVAALVIGWRMLGAAGPIIANESRGRRVGSRSA